MENNSKEKEARYWAEQYDTCVYHLHCLSDLMQVLQCACSYTADDEQAFLRERERYGRCIDALCDLAGAYLADAIRVLEAS
ncbi:MAG: hypothetical protein Q4F18_11055 [Clostridia bacterium]|nr:hypothetical protein [Clostridia bacterium]